MNNIEQLNNEELLEYYKILKQYIEELEKEIQKVEEND